MILLVLLIPIIGKAQQDVSFAHYWAMEPSFNPASVGKEEKLNIAAGYALQLAGFENNPKTMYVAGDMPFYALNSYHGVGLQLMNDDIGLFSHKRLGLQYALKKKLFGGMLSVGVQATVLSEGFDGTKLDVIDQNDPALATTDITGTGFDLGAGLYFKHKDWYAGVSALHLNSPKVDLGETNEIDISSTYYLTGGYNIRLKNPFLTIHTSALGRTDGVAWRADDLKRAVTHLDDLAIVQPAVGKLAFALERNTEQQRLLFRALEIGFHVGMCRHFDAVFLLDSRIAYDVVEMAVRVDGQNGFEAMAVDETKELVFGTDCITAWVDDDAVLGVGVVNDVSVFREGVENELFYIEHNDVFRGKDNAFWEALRDFAYLCGLIFDTDVVKNEIHAPVSIALRRGTHSPWPVLQRHEHAFREEPRAVERLPLVVLSERQF